MSGDIKTETLADICQKIRDGGLPDLADHIERAWKRERDILIYSFDPTKAAKSLAPDGSAYALEALEYPQSAPVGNAVVMHDALLKVKKLFDGRIMWQNEIREAHKAVIAALAKPPRNCDRFDGDIDRLREACLRERGLNPEEDFPDVFPDWLLALSTAKEGGAK